MVNFMKKWQVLFLAVVFILGLTLAGCSQKQLQSKPGTTAVYKATDIRGKELSFSKKPQHIVCTYVFADEILLDLVSHDRIAGLDRWVHDPELSSAVKEARDVKTIVENNTESILKVKPDLVLLPPYVKPEMIDSLEEVGLKVFVYKDSRRLHEIPDMIRSIASAVGEKSRGEELVATLNKDLDAVKKMKKPGNPEEKALMFMRFGAFGGKGTIYNDVLTELGFNDCYNTVRKETVTGQNLKGILSKEEVVKANPDVFLMALWTQGGAYDDSKMQLQEMYSDPAFATVNAVKNKRAYIFPQRLVNSLSHHAGKNLIELAELLK